MSIRRFTSTPWPLSSTAFKCRLAAVAAIIVSGLTCCAVTDESQYASIADKAALDTLAEQLARPEDQMNALAVLVRFASSQIFQIGSLSVSLEGDTPAMTALRREAADLAGHSATVTIVNQSLQSADLQLQRWGIWMWRSKTAQALRDAGREPLELPEKNLTADEQEWADLIPSVRQLTTGFPYRVTAIQALAFADLRHQQAFLRELIPRETSATVILNILDYTCVQNTDGSSDRDRQYNRQLLRLLSHKDTSVRTGALSEIASNWQNAEMYRVRFAEPVKHRVNELTRSRNAEERSSAEAAAKAIAQHQTK